MNSVYSIVAILFLLLSVSYASVAPPNSVPMKVVNEAGAPIELYWVNVFQRNELVKQTTKPIRNSSDTVINSYDTHRFQVQFFKKKPNEKIHRAEFVKGPRDEVVLVRFVNNEFVITQTTKYDEILNNIKSAAESCRANATATDGGSNVNQCIANTVVHELHTLTESKQLLAKYRDAVSERLRNYTCADLTLQSTEPLSTFPIHFKGGKRLTGTVLFDLPNAKVWTVENFISDEECEVLKKFGKPRLTRATVAAEDGTSIVSQNRRANQASYNLHEHDVNDPLWPLYRRIFDVTNHHTGFNLTFEGQEDFTIIQYDKSDEYKPHCDGACDGSTHISGGRVATAVMYCEVPTLGGSTTFTKADVFVKPVKGMATFFSYMDKKTKHMDEGFTEHSGCPVLEGEKWIATVWMRIGVDRANDWTVFDPAGVRIFDSEKEKSQHELEVGVGGM